MEEMCISLKANVWKTKEKTIMKDFQVQIYKGTEHGNLPSHSFSHNFSVTHKSHSSQERVLSQAINTICL